MNASFSLLSVNLTPPVERLKLKIHAQPTDLAYQGRQQRQQTSAGHYSVICGQYFLCRGSET